MYQFSLLFSLFISAMLNKPLTARGFVRAQAPRVMLRLRMVAPLLASGVTQPLMYVHMAYVRLSPPNFSIQMLFSHYLYIKADSKLRGRF